MVALMYEITTPLIQKDVSLRQLNSETNATLYPLESPFPPDIDIDNRNIAP